MKPVDLFLLPFFFFGGGGGKKGIRKGKKKCECESGLVCVRFFKIIWWADFGILFFFLGGGG